MASVFLLAEEGFEEIELVSIVDILRRAQVELKIVGGRSLKVQGAHGLVIEADLLLEGLSTVSDMIVLPGGEPGTTNLEKNQAVKQCVLDHYEQGKFVAAICA